MFTWERKNKKNNYSRCLRLNGLPISLKIFQQHIWLDHWKLWDILRTTNIEPSEIWYLLETQKIKNLCLFQLSQTWSASKYLKISQQHIGWIAKNFEKFWELQFSIISLSQNFSKFSVFQQNMLLEKFEILASPWDSWNNHIFLYFFVSNKHFIPVGSMFVVLKTLSQQE